MTMPILPTVTPYRTTVIDDDVTGEFFTIEVVSIVAKDLNPCPNRPCSKSREQVADQEFEMLARYDAGGVTLSPATNGVHPCFWESDGQELHYHFNIRINWPRAGRPVNVSCSASDNVTFASFRVNGTSYGIEYGKIILPLK